MHLIYNYNLYDPIGRKYKNSSSNYLNPKVFEKIVMFQNYVFISYSVGTAIPIFVYVFSYKKYYACLDC